MTTTVALRPLLYILDNRTAVPCRDPVEWARWFVTPGVRRIAMTDVGGARVSTVFLGVDHSLGIGPPRLFETMVFGGPHDGVEERSSTFEEAEATHDKWVQRLQQGKHR